MRIKHRLAALLLSCFVLTGCSAGEGFSGEASTPEIVIALSMRNHYGISQLLQQEEYLSQLGASCGLRFSLEILAPSEIEDFKVIAPFDVLITDDSVLVAPLSNELKISQLKAIPDVPNLAYGRSGGWQYGYVFQEPGRVSQEAQLLVNDRMLSASGLTEVPYTAASFRTLLEALSLQDVIPLAVYGNPAESGCSVLQGLFGITPQGGHEFYIEDGTLYFDKLTSGASDYLQYVYDLYSDQLLPQNFLSLNEYSCRSMFISEQVAMTVAPSPEAAQSLVEYAAKHGVEASIVEVPTSPGLLETDVFSQPVGVIANGCAYSTQITDAFLQLQSDLDQLSLSGDAVQTPLQLFTATPTEAIDDPLLHTLSDVQFLYYKCLLDAQIIEPYYSQLAIGELSPHQFQAMCDEWLTGNLSPYFNDSTISKFSGSRILQVFQSWIDRPTATDRAQFSY